MMVVWLFMFLTVLCVGLQCVIVLFSDHTHLLFYDKVRINPTVSATMTSENTFQIENNRSGDQTAHMGMLIIAFVVLK